MRTVLLTLLQLVGLVAAGTGLYLLAGLAWTLLVAGIAVVLTATLAELPSRAGSGGGRF